MISPNFQVWRLLYPPLPRAGPNMARVRAQTCKYDQSGIFWLASVPILMTNRGKIWHAKPMVYGHMPNFIWIGIFCHPRWGKNTQILPYFQLCHTNVVPPSIVEKTLNTGVQVQLQTFPYPMYQNFFCVTAAHKTRTFLNNCQRNKPLQSIYILKLHKIFSSCRVCCMEP